MTANARSTPARTAGCSVGSRVPRKGGLRKSRSQGAVKGLSAAQSGSRKTSAIGGRGPSSPRSPIGRMGGLIVATRRVSKEGDDWLIAPPSVVFEHHDDPRYNRITAGGPRRQCGAGGATRHEGSQLGGSAARKRCCSRTQSALSGRESAKGRAAGRAAARLPNRGGDGRGGRSRRAIDRRASLRGSEPDLLAAVGASAGAQRPLPRRQVPGTPALGASRASRTRSSSSCGPPRGRAPAGSSSPGLRRSPTRAAVCLRRGVKGIVPGCPGPLGEGPPSQAAGIEIRIRLGDRAPRGLFLTFWATCAKVGHMSLVDYLGGVVVPRAAARQSCAGPLAISLVRP